MFIGDKPNLKGMGSLSIKKKYDRAIYCSDKNHTLDWWWYTLTSLPHLSKLVQWVWTF